MPLAVDRYELGPLQTNCYVVRSERGAAECAVIDPGGDAADLRLELARLGTSCAGILITHGHFDHLGGVADLAEGTGAEVWMPEGERERLERYPEFAPVGVPGRPHAPEHLVSGGETIEVAGISFECLAVPGPLAGARRLLRRGRALQRRPALRRLGRPRRPARRRLGHAARLRPHAHRAAPARDGRPPGPRPRDDARRRARAQPVPGRAARGGVSSKFQAPRGTHDVLPRDHLWWRVIRTIEEQCAQYGWSRVSTPGFEETALFERTSGEASDVVHKEMYTFVDRGDRSLTLRPEGTAPIARAYVEHGLAQEPQPVKAYTIAPMYRYSRPGPRPLPRALAAVARGDRLGGSRRRRRGDPVLRRSSCGGSASPSGSCGSTRSATRTAGRSTSRA